CVAVRSRIRTRGRRSTAREKAVKHAAWRTARSLTSSRAWSRGAGDGRFGSSTLDADHCDEGLGAGTEVFPHDPPGTMPSTNKPIRNSARANDSGKKPVVVDRSSLDRWSHDPSW